MTNRLFAAVRLTLARNGMPTLAAKDFGIMPVKEYICEV